MHINKISFGSYIKLLLRSSFRDGKRVHKVTHANVSKWSPEELTELQSALAEIRGIKGRAKRREAEKQILDTVVAPRVSTEHYWRLHAEHAPSSGKQVQSFVDINAALRQCTTDEERRQIIQEAARIMPIPEAWHSYIKTNPKGTEPWQI